MKKFEDYITVTPEYFEHMQRRVIYGKPGIFVYDGTEPDKNDIGFFADNHELDSEDVWKFFVYFKFLWFAQSNTKDFDKTRWNGFQTDLNSIKELFNNLELGTFINGKHHQVTVEKIGLHTNLFGSVKLENPIIIERITKALRKEFSESEIREPSNSKKTGTYQKEFIESLYPFFEYLLDVTQKPKNDVYWILYDFIKLIIPDFESADEVEYIKKRMQAAEKL